MIKYFTQLSRDNPALFAVILACAIVGAIIFAIVALVVIAKRIKARRSITDSPQMSKADMDYLTKKFEEYDLTQADKDFIHKFYDHTGYRQH